LIDGSHGYKSSVMSDSGRDSNLMAIGTIILGFSVLNSNLKVIKNDYLKYKKKKNKKKKI
jgi:hypothetical protein